MTAKLDKARENLARALDAKTKADEEAKRQAEEQEQQQQPQQAAPIPTPAPTPTPQYHGSSGGTGSTTVPRGNNGRQCEQWRHRQQRRIVRRELRRMVRATGNP